MREHSIALICPRSTLNVFLAKAALQSNEVNTYDRYIEHGNRAVCR
jgi:hypothetical protein